MHVFRDETGYYIKLCDEIQIAIEERIDNAIRNTEMDINLLNLNRILNILNKAALEEVSLHFNDQYHALSLS